MSSSRYLLEVIATSADDARAAAQGGAERLEVCSALALGGLTPSIGTIRAIRSAIEIPIMAMLRPREGGMAYSEGEFEAMLADAEALLEAGVEGLVFGFLTPEGEIDLERNRHLMSLARSQSRSVDLVFHRAFDVVARPDIALAQLIDLGITRILTSGRKQTAVEGIDGIRRTVEQAKGRIQILAGGGIRVENVEPIIRGTGVTQVHCSATRLARDSSTWANPTLRFGGLSSSDEETHATVNPDYVRGIRDRLDRI